MTRSILFVCNMNSVRSPMAAALLRLQAKGAAHIDSAGVYEGGLDPFVEIVMKELGVSMLAHEPKSLSDVDLRDIDLIIALTQEARAAAESIAPKDKIEFWATENPSDERGDRDAVIDAYRRVRDQLAARIGARFPEFQENP